MSNVIWTPSLVEERLVEAADVLKRLPERKAQGYFNTWPAMSYEFSDLVGRPATLRACLKRVLHAGWLHDSRHHLQLMR